MIHQDVGELLERGTVGVLLEEEQKEQPGEYRPAPGQCSPAPLYKDRGGPSSLWLSVSPDLFCFLSLNQTLSDSFTVSR